MAERLQVFKCASCGHVVLVLHAGAGALVCCNQPMTALQENTTDAAKEKHVPVVEKVEGGFKVKVGSVAHPMTAEHLIEWIALTADGKVSLAFLSPGAAPEAVFKSGAASASARAYCNLHGLWKG